MIGNYNTDRWLAGRSYASADDAEIDKRCAKVSEWLRIRRRAGLRRECVRAWSKPGHKTQESIAASLGISASHVGVLLREAGVVVGRGHNNRATPRLQAKHGGFYSANRDAVQAAAAAVLAIGKKSWGALKVAALTHGVPDSSVSDAVKRSRGIAA